jgi:TonB family protein
MGLFCASDLASLDKSLAGLRESLGKLRAAKPVDIAEVTEQLRRGANSAGIVRELVWSELPDASWQSREELDHLVAEIQKILDARAIEQLRSRLLALATELERGRIVHRRANRVSELNHLRSQAINELRNQAGLKGAPPTLTGPQAGQWVEWACSLQEPEDAESLQALRNGFPHLDDFVANLEPNMWIAAESPAVGILLEPDGDEETPRVPSRPQQRRFDESSASSEPSVASRGGFDPRYVKVVDPRLTEKAPHSHPHEGAASSVIPAMQPGAAVLTTALASLDDSLAGMRESLGLLGAAKSVELAEVTGYLKRAAEYARVVRESVWSELPEASWQNRKELDALVVQVQNVVEARHLEQLRNRLLALATELEQGTIVHRRAHRLNELNQLRERAIHELRSQAGLHVAPQTLPGPEADRWIAWAEALREPDDVEALQALRDGFPHLDDFIANLEPNLWVAAKPPAVEVPPEPEKPADKKPAEKIPPSRMEKTRVEEAAALAEPLPTETEAPSEVRQEEAGFTELLDRLRRKRPRPSTPPAEEEPQPISKEEPALLATVVEPAREPVERTAPPVEPPPPSAEVPTETSAAPGIALRVKTGAEELWSGDWRKLLATPAVLVCLALLLVLVLGAAVWRLRRNHAGVTTVQATEKVPDQAPGSPQNNGSAQPGMPGDAAISAAQASTPKTEVQQPLASATQPSSPKTEAAKQSKPQDQNSFAKMLASIKQGNNNTVASPPAAAQGNTATPKKEEAAPPVVAPNGAENIVKNIPVAVSTTTDRPPGAAAPQPTTTAALQPPASAPQPVASAPPPASAGPQKVSSGVAQGLLVRQVAPQYPQAARQAHIQGTVVLQVVIGKDGNVQNLHALSGPPLLIPSAMDAVKQWRYKPYQLNGEPVEANTQINVKFSLPNE